MAFKLVKRPDLKKIQPIGRGVKWARRNSLWLLHLGIMCCAIEMMQAGFAFHDFERIGVLARATPRQVDVILVNGPVNRKIAERLRRLFMQTPGPRYVIVMGECAINGGPWWESEYVLDGIHELIRSLPEEIRKQTYVVNLAGCPPRPEALIRSILKMEELIRGGDLSEAKLTKYPVNDREGSNKKLVDPMKRYIHGKRKAGEVNENEANVGGK
ncbi:NADH dehydrogenase subunit B [Ignicoccus islandicus DSM 13165]|uniref:NADH dehydrogenase subunit B n=1 Tax=Ignicoccus islandicus DSM 13165 TaxID=940295 RepID=A0A0U2M993_9CREN|nr:NADH-quinone oxidoreductase subunit NuoB [Ignicoccus islandicus]ALU11533.1 NADH dehydrogenase subunit B [Ignicoccus islandicus DSM 13165]